MDCSPYLLSSVTQSSSLESSSASGAETFGTSGLHIRQFHSNSDPSGKAPDSNQKSVPTTNPNPPASKQVLNPPRRPNPAPQPVARPNPNPAPNPKPNPVSNPISQQALNPNPNPNKIAKTVPTRPKPSPAPPASQHPGPGMEPRATAILAGVCHAVVLLTLGAGCLVVHIAVKSFQRGFYCDDESIGYPLKPGTVPFNVCVGVAVVLGLLIVSVVEALRHRYASERVKSGSPAHPTLLSLVGRVLPEKFAPPIAAIVAGLYQLTFACLVNELFTVVGKKGFGRPRPHFLAACQLNTTCVPGRLYTPEFCRPPNKADFDNAQKSFPSGHSSFCMVVCVYLAVYMQARLAFRHPLHSLKNLCQVALVLLGSSVAMSRVSDYKHHWSDILAGSLIGVVCGILVASKFFSYAPGRAGSQAVTAAYTETPSVGGGSGQAGRDFVA